MSEQRVTISVVRDDNDGACKIQALGGMSMSGLAQGNPLEVGTVFEGPDATEVFAAMGAKLDELYLAANPDQQLARRHSRSE